MAQPGPARVDFFLSYTQADRPWAEWIAWVLEEAGFATKIQAWDFRPGSNFPLEMQKASAGAERTVPVLSQQPKDQRLWAASDGLERGEALYLPCAANGSLAPAPGRQVATLPGSCSDAPAPYW